MDIEEFEKRVPPKAKKSRLEPFHEQIFRLREKGYALWQIREFLKANSLDISTESIRKYIKSRTKNKNDISKGKSSSETNSTHSETEKTTEHDEDINLEELSAKQRREKLADRFIKPDNTNPLLKSLKENKK
ncbi:hypothetical protein ACWJKU_19830 (plasmid) [Methylocaldum sp. MU1018]|jgi:hypothetical protein